MTFFLERTELALLSDCVLLWPESELISITCSGGGGLKGAFLSSLGAGLAGGMAAFCCKSTFNSQKQTELNASSSQSLFLLQKEP